MGAPTAGGRMCTHQTDGPKRLGLQGQNTEKYIEEALGARSLTLRLRSVE
jgi:hypothetical protein